jgi:HAD superfamily hydrolase (TIGR01450 family)
VDPVDVFLDLVRTAYPQLADGCFTVGTPALARRLTDGGIRVFTSPADGAPKGVFLGSTIRFDYNDLAHAARFVRQGAPLFAAGREAVFLWKDELWPGVGALCAAVEIAAGSEAVVVGKPDQRIFRHAANLLPLGARITVVGDDVRTDIEGARRAGFKSVLLTSGVPQLVRSGSETPAQADLVMPDLEAYVRLLAPQE